MYKINNKLSRKWINWIMIITTLMRGLNYSIDILFKTIIHLFDNGVKCNLILQNLRFFAIFDI